MATPAMAAASASSQAAQASVQAETVEGMQLRGGNMLVVVLALIGVGLGLWVLLDDDKDRPVSP
jgi:hypothetical protein